MGIQETRKLARKKVKTSDVPYLGYSLEIEVPVLATDSNKTLRGNRFVHSKTRQRVKSIVARLVVGKEPVKPLINFKISITRHSSRSLDWDNLVSSFKPIIDGLVISKIIQNDSWKYIKFIETDQVTSLEKKLVVKINEVKCKLLGLDEGKKERCSTVQETTKDIPNE